jgi:polyferredoxin
MLLHRVPPVVRRNADRRRPRFSERPSRKAIPVPDRFRRVRDIVTSRMFVRSVFLVFFVGACAQLLLFVRWAEGKGAFVPRPEAVAGLLPIGHFTSFFGWVRGGGWDVLLPAGLVIIIAAIAVSLLFKRGFCGWICPLGTVWEIAELAGRAVFGHPVVLPKWLDRVGRGIRYALAAMILTWLLLVPVAEAVAFRELQYMWTADIKILTGLGTPAFLVAGLVAFVLSMIFSPVWCRYVCPLGGWYSVLGMASPCAVHRDGEACISCHRCNRVCHALVDVENARNRVWAPECDGCMDCVRACPAPGALEARVLGRWRIPVWVWPVLVVGTWLLIYGVARLTHNWDTTIPNDAFKQIINSGLLQQRTPGGL